jgi:hypothetical protein
LNPFCSGYFGDRVLLFAQVGLDHCLPIFMLPAISGMTGVQHHIQLFSIAMGVSQIFLLGLACNHDPPELNLSNN